MTFSTKDFGFGFDFDFNRKYREGTFGSKGLGGMPASKFPELKELIDKAHEMLKQK